MSLTMPDVCTMQDRLRIPMRGYEVLRGLPRFAGAARYESP